MRHQVAAALLAIVIAAATLSARAEPAPPPQPSAMRHWESGLKLFEKKKYEGALAEFAHGYALSHKPGFLFNMAECARLLGDRPQAHQLYRRYLGEHPQGKLRAEALAHCRELGLGPCAASAGPASSVAPPPRPTPTALAPARPDLVPASGASSNRPPARPRPFYKRWPLWVGIGAVVVAGSVTASVLATRPRGRSAPDGEATLDLSR